MGFVNCKVMAAISMALLFPFKAAQGEIIVISEGYVAKQGAKLVLLR